MENINQQQINLFKDFIPRNRGGVSMVSYPSQSSIIPGEEPDFFQKSDTEAATSAGAILVGGLAIRHFLQSLSSNWFSKYFSKKQDVDEKELMSITENMLRDKKLIEKPVQEIYTNADVYKDRGTYNKLKVVIEPNGDKAFFDPLNKQIRVTKNTLISLPHEIGHAVEEHSTKLLKKLQRNRGNYTTLALLLYGLGREKSTNKKGQETIIGKIQNTIYKYNILIPLLAFAPELITEFAASKIGIDYIKTHIKNLKNKPQTKNTQKSIINSQKILKNAKKHYAIAFCTYLALPAFAVLDNLIFKESFKRR